MDANNDVVSVVDLAALAQESTIWQPVWAYQSAWPRRNTSSRMSS